MDYEMAYFLLCLHPFLHPWDYHPLLLPLPQREGPQKLLLQIVQRRFPIQCSVHRGLEWSEIAWEMQSLPFNSDYDDFKDLFKSEVLFERTKCILARLYDHEPFWVSKAEQYGWRNQSSLSDYQVGWKVCRQISQFKHSFISKLI